MAKRYDICSPRKGRDDKTFWTRIGVAWESEKGIQLVFEALPLPDSEGRCVANLFEPRETQSGRGEPKQSYSGGGGSNRFTDDGDDIPFATNDSIW